MNSRGRATFYVHIEVRTPAKLTKEQRTLLETLSRTLP
jgi:DnaJ-class molecular chaperone